MEEYLSVQLPADFFPAFRGHVQPKRCGCGGPLRGLPGAGIGWVDQPSGHAVYRISDRHGKRSQCPRGPQPGSRKPEGNAGNDPYLLPDLSSDRTFELHHRSDLFENISYHVKYKGRTAGWCRELFADIFPWYARTGTLQFRQRRDECQRGHKTSAGIPVYCRNPECDYEPGLCHRVSYGGRRRGDCQYYGAVSVSGTDPASPVVPERCLQAANQQTPLPQGGWTGCFNAWNPGRSAAGHFCDRESVCAGRREFV